MRTMEMLSSSTLHTVVAKGSANTSTSTDRPSDGIEQKKTSQLLNLLSLMGMNLNPRQGLSRFILIGLMVIDGSLW